MLTVMELTVLLRLALLEQEARQIMVVKAEVTAQPPGPAVNPSLGAWA